MKNDPIGFTEANAMLDRNPTLRKKMRLFGAIVLSSVAALFGVLFKQRRTIRKLKRA